MLLDPKRIPINKNALITSFNRDLRIARSKKPFPFLTYRDGLSFTEDMRTHSIVPSEIDSNSSELETLEHTGAEIAARCAFNIALHGDIILENVPGLILFARRAMARYGLTHDQFGVSRMVIHDRECEYWKTRGTYFADQLKETQGILGSTELRVWYLHEIRLAMKKGLFLKTDFHLDEHLHYIAARRIYHELAEQFITIQKTHPLERMRVTHISRYNFLVLLSGEELREYPR